MTDIGTPRSWGTPRSRGTLSYRNGQLTLSGPTLNQTVAAATIGEICRCTMEDEVHHGDECFHILILDDTFLLIGPFVAGALGAIEALTTANPDIPVTRQRVRTVPFGFREPGFLGLRLFPVPGLRTGSRADLKRFHLVPVEDPHV